MLLSCRSSYVPFLWSCVRSRPPFHRFLFDRFSRLAPLLRIQSQSTGRQARSNERGGSQAWAVYEHPGFGSPSARAGEGAEEGSGWSGLHAGLADAGTCLDPLQSISKSFSFADAHFPLLESDVVRAGCGMAFSLHRLLVRSYGFRLDRSSPFGIYYEKRRRHTRSRQDPIPRR
jgi:hypothetical protein